MSYFKDYGKTTDWVGTVTADAETLVDNHCKIVTGVQGYNNVTAEDLRKQILSAKSNNAFGIVIFRYGDLSSDEWQVVQDLYVNWQETQSQ